MIQVCLSFFPCSKDLSPIYLILLFDTMKASVEGSSANRRWTEKKKTFESKEIRYENITGAKN